MKFWDSSALLPLFAAETRTRAVQSMYSRDSEAVVWWDVLVECASAIARLERDGALSASDAAESIRKREHVAENRVVFNIKGNSRAVQLSD